MNIPSMQHSESFEARLDLGTLSDARLRMLRLVLADVSSEAAFVGSAAATFDGWRVCASRAGQHGADGSASVDWWLWHGQACVARSRVQASCIGPLQ
jgi:hypothetical protein